MSSAPGNSIPVRNPFPPTSSISTPVPAQPPQPQSQPQQQPPVSGMNVPGQNPPPPSQIPQQPQGIPVQIPGGGLLSPATASALEHYRLTQLYQYAMAAERLRVPPGSFGMSPGIPPGLRPELAPLFYGPYCRIDPRLAGLCRAPEEPKPQFSYIGLIAMAILSSPDKKLVLSDIYQYILDNYPYFRTRGPGWRNSIRHNLSLNDCFVKAGRSANGKGHYWAIHPANVDDFTKGDFRRRKAQRKVRRHMGLQVDDDDSPSPPPASPPPVWQHPHHPLFHPGAAAAHALATGNPMALAGSPPNPGALDLPGQVLFGLSAAAAAAANLKNAGPEAMNHLNPQHPHHHHHHHHHHSMSSTLFNRKRQFDVASLLAPEKESSSGGALSPNSYKSDDNEQEQDRDQSLSSPSPPLGSDVTTGLKRSKIFKRSIDFGARNDSSEDDDESIEVTEDENLGKSNFSRKSEMFDSLEKSVDSEEKVEARESDNSSRGGSPTPLSGKEKNTKVPSNVKTEMGHCATSSNEEDNDDSACKSFAVNANYNFLSARHHQTPINMLSGRPVSNNGAVNHENENSLVGQNVNNMFPGNLQMLNLNQQNLMSHAHSLEVLQAHHLAQQQQQQSQNHHQVASQGGPGQGAPPQGHPVPFPFGIPGSQQFLQQNPSLASLMLLSSKYRELTMNAAAMKRPQP